MVNALHLANRNIKIPLPIDSCCFISLVSKKPADLVSQNCPDLKFTKLATPLSVSVASADSKLQAVGTMLQIPIVCVCGGRGGGWSWAMTPSVPLSFYKQLLPLPKPLLLLPPPQPSPRPPNKNFGRRLDFAWTLFCVNFCSY